MTRDEIKAVLAKQRDEKTTYRKGARVHADTWCEDRWTECGGGIHHYMTREEAEAHK